MHGHSWSTCCNALSCVSGNYARLSTLSCMQDTYLLATQQEVTLAAELAAHMASSASPENGHDSHSSSAAEGSGIPTGATGLTRRRIFCHR